MSFRTRFGRSAAAADDAADGLLIGDGERQAGLPGHTAVDLPAAEGLSGDALEVFAERQFVVCRRTTSDA